MLTRRGLQKYRILSTLTLSLLLGSCGGGGGQDGGNVNIDAGVFGPSASGSPDSFRGAGVVNDEKFLFGGMLTRGRRGDVLLQNDKIRIIVQKPDRSAGVGMFGGNIIDADRFRPASEPGQDQFGVVYPLINLSWTANYQRLEIINGDFSQGPVVVRATGAIDVYDYIQTNIIVPFARIFSGVDLSYSDNFDDSLNPFDHVLGLRDLNRTVVTDYILKSDSDYVTLETRFQNDGSEAIPMPVGDWVNGSGALEQFIPGRGFVRAAQIDNVPAVAFQAIEDDVNVSYGYFFNPIEYMGEDGKLPGAASLSVSGVTPMVLGEGSLLNILPMGNSDPKINFKVEPGARKITRYFAVGTGDIASVMEAGFNALGIDRIHISGKVTDGSGQAVARARVIAMQGDAPVTMTFSDTQGNFSMSAPSGKDSLDQFFGKGVYKIQVYKEGYVLSGDKRSGKCTGGSLDATQQTFSGIECKLGEYGIVKLSGEVDGSLGPVRITILGFDPSEIHTPGFPEDFGKYRDISNEERPYGVVDVLYLDPSGELFPRGNQRRLSEDSIRLEPGEYTLYFSRGPEYSMDHQRITVAAGDTQSVHGSIEKVIDTTGYVNGDFHVHGINSPDSPFRMDNRLRNSMAEGLDILINTDHEFVTDLQPMLKELQYQDWITTIPGDEITPLANGHMVTWPLTPNPDRPDNGAYDYTYVPSDDILNPDHDLVQSIEEIIKGVDETNPGTQVFSIAHITDKALGQFSIAELVTSPSFEGVEPLSTYSDPVKYRLPTNTNEKGGFMAPFPVGTNGLFSINFTSLGLTIGTASDILEHLMETSLPTYFNLLNLGKICSATADSDTHSQIKEPIGIPRNFVLSSIDPNDGIGSYPEIDPEELAQNVNAGKLFVSNGVILKTKLKSAQQPDGVTVGGTLSGTGQVTLELEISSIENFDWDKVEIYANTLPTPAKDDMSGVTDLSAEEFHHVTQSHLPKYLMAPLYSFHKNGNGDAALNQTVNNGVRKAVLSKDFNFSEDTWIVVVVRGGKSVQSTFPFVTKEANRDVPPEDFLDTLENNPALIHGIPAFAFSNPMFVDVDGNGFEALLIREGISPLAP